MNPKDIEKQYLITSLCKEDILQHFSDYPQSVYRHIHQRVLAMTSQEMETISGRMGELYTQTRFWDDLEDLFIERCPEGLARMILDHEG